MSDVRVKGCRTFGGAGGEEKAGMERGRKIPLQNASTRGESTLVSLDFAPPLAAALAPGARQGLSRGGPVFRLSPVVWDVRGAVRRVRRGAAGAGVT